MTDAAVVTSSTPPRIIGANTPDGDQVISTQAKPPEKGPCSIRQWNTHTFTCDKQPFEFTLPCSHEEVPHSHLEGLKTNHETLKQHREVMNFQQFSCRANVSKFRAIIATALAATAAWLLPRLLVSFHWPSLCSHCALPWFVGPDQKQFERASSLIFSISCHSAKLSNGCCRGQCGLAF